MNPDLVTAGLGGKHIECEEGHCGGAVQPEGSEATLHRCRDQYVGMKSEVAKRLRQLEYENRRLKQLLVDLSLKNRMLKYVTSKEYLEADKQPAAKSASQRLPSLLKTLFVSLLVLKERHAAVMHHREKFTTSERRACGVLGVPRPSNIMPSPSHGQSRDRSVIDVDGASASSVRGSEVDAMIETIRLGSELEWHPSAVQ